jgi:RNA polymerase sigma-70 factor (ECF subfamily)
MSGGPIIDEEQLTRRIEEPAATDAGNDDQRAWIQPLMGRGTEHDRAVLELHGLLLRASRFEVHRRARAMGCAEDSDLDDLATQSADDALVLVLAKLDTFEGRSRFTTWAYKFAIHVAGVAVRRHVWRDRAMRAPAEALGRLTDRAADPAARAEERDLLARIAGAVAQLTPHQRNVLVTLAVDGVPIDVLAERLSTNRNALYKTLHDARRRVRTLLDQTEVKS